jgi:hypothetical protein
MSVSDEGLQLMQEFYFCGKIFAAVRHIDGREDEILYLSRDDASFEIEVGMAKDGLFSEGIATDV